MANEKNAEKAIKTVEDTVIKATITKVMEPQVCDNRISLITNTEFDVVDFTTGEVKKSSIIGINTYNLVNQIKAFVPYVKVVDALCMGKPINPQILSLCLNGAEIRFKRLFHAAGEQRQFEGVYEKDCYTTEIQSVTTHIDEVSKMFLLELIKSQPYAKVEAKDLNGKVLIIGAGGSSE